ncbi:MAG: LysM peptidoglycan-binding domain-containing protein [Candidatus Saccharibacteria bacterium]
MENHISRSAFSGTLESLPGLGVGTIQETFSNIKTPQAATKRRATSSAKRTAQAGLKSATASARTAYQPRFAAHLGILALASLIVFGNNPAKTHGIAIRILSAHSGIGSSLDSAATASVAADVATKSNLIVAHDASKSADTMNQQVALVSADDISLGKRQVVATAGNATRDISSYSVQNGDTLSSIASKFNVTTSTLKWANSLTETDAIKPGQSLTILPVTGLLYVVKAGDTAESLAKTYQANEAQILSFNNAEIKGLSAGDKIIIPDGIKYEAPAPVVAPTRVAASSNFTPRLTSFAFSGNGYSYGYCTYYVASRRSIPSYWGDARNWYYNAQASGFSVGSVPVAGAIAWTGAGYYGHVAYVESVNGNSVTVSEMNFNGGWNRVSYRTASASSFRYIY